MYYLAKFCIICVKTGVELINTDTTDYDSIKLSDKLFACTKMKIENNRLSSDICTTCLQKLRIAYDFHEMCKKSEKILSNYIAELTGSLSNRKFNNCELRVSLTPVIRLQHQRKKRVSKEQRCSLLKRLLTKIREEGSSADDKQCKLKGRLEEDSKKQTSDGGLRDLMDFTKNFDFGFRLDPNKSYEISPLEKLVNFSKNFFYGDFTDFHGNLAMLLESESSCDGFNSEDDFVESSKNIKIEEVILEPEINIKTECDYEDERDYDMTTNFLEICYENKDSLKPSSNEDYFSEVEVKKEPKEYSTDNFKPQSANNLGKNKHLCNLLNTPVIQQNVSATDLLGKFVAQFSDSKRTLSPNSLRCRTRGSPYINPQLQKQFQLRNFSCKTCNRTFKSPGYLNAHIVKLKH